MYRFKVKDTVFTIPEENIRMFAIFEAMNRGNNDVELSTDEQAMEYLKTLGIEVVQ